MLQDSKHGLGPCTSIEELHLAFREHSEKGAFIGKTGMAYYAHTHKAEKVLRPERFRLTAITHEKIENLWILLEGEDALSSLTVPNLLTNAKAEAAMPQNMATEAIDKLNDRTQVADLNDTHLVIWSDTTGKYNWFLGCIKNITNTHYEIDHLHGTTTISDIKWSYPSTEDNQFAEKEQLIACKIKGMWESHDTRNIRFHLSNSKNIGGYVKEYINIIIRQTIRHKFQWFVLFNLILSNMSYSKHF